MKEKKPNREKRKIIIRDQPGRKEKPTVESFERLRRTAEEKGWTKKNKRSAVKHRQESFPLEAELIADRFILFMEGIHELSKGPEIHQGSRVGTA
jgi:hypothetical protein